MVSRPCIRVMLAGSGDTSEVGVGEISVWVVGPLECANVIMLPFSVVRHVVYSSIIVSRSIKKHNVKKSIPQAWALEMCCVLKAYPRKHLSDESL